MPDSATHLGVDPLIAVFHASDGRRVMDAVAEMERTFAPAEIVAFAQMLAASDHPQRAAILERDCIAELRSARKVQPYRRVQISPDVSFYSAGGPAVEKTLVIGFGGMGGRLGLPIGLVLQAIDAHRFDLVMLRDPAQRSYSFGVGAYAPDFIRLVAQLNRDFRPERYRRLVTIGNSMGAAPALRAGFWMGAERGIAMGARRPNDALMLVLRRPVGPALDPFCECLQTHPQRGLLVYAEGCATDVEAAQHLAAQAAGRPVIFAGMHDHNLVWRFWTMGALRAYLTLLLDGPLPADRHNKMPPVVIGRLWLPRLRADLGRRIRRWIPRKTR